MSGFSEDGAPYSAPTSKREFLSWIERQERRHEFVRGRVIMQAGGSKTHARLQARFITALSNRLDSDVWSTTTSDFAVEIGDDIRYPDVMVERTGGSGRDRTTSKPVLLIEILSPSSVGTDMTEKLAEYTSLPSLEAYVVASQEAPIVWVWQRDPATRAFPAQSQEISGGTSQIEIAALALSLPLGELYRGIVEL